MPPEFNKDFFCIVDRSQPELAAVISSYIHISEKYLPVFEFPAATTENKEVGDDHFDEHVITRRRSEEFNVLTVNSLRRMGGCKYLILAGLSEMQKSYLTFLDDYNVIEIGAIQDVDFRLGGLVPNINNELLCTQNEILKGLYKAAKSNSKLIIQENAELLLDEEDTKKGIVIIENISATSTVIAINYALSIDAAIKVIEPLEENEEKEIKYLIQDWKKGSDGHLVDLTERLHKKIAGIYFPQYEFATFFTEGAPYSLILHNVIPFTYVHLIFRPDLFIFNNIFFENAKSIDSAVVFSPLIFKKNEETDFVIRALKQQNLFVKELVGKDATVFNVDMHVKEFPYDLFHICSHGGEVGGYTITEEFQDRHGVTHNIEYDEVVSFAPKPGDELIPVHTKSIWRKFDGLIWKSAELKAKNYSHDVFTDMLIELDKKRKGKEKQLRVHKNIIPDSCAIKCYDFNYQAMFDVVAGYHTSPIIFNNTCWSWSGIADSFLSGGVRGYIGTIWAINNQVAMNSAETFYMNSNKSTILSSLQAAMEITKGTTSEDIYMYWGLHFSTIKSGSSSENSRQNVVECLLRSFYRWNDRIKEVSSKSIKENIYRLVNWHSEQLRKYFFWDYLKMRFTSKPK